MSKMKLMMVMLGAVLLSMSGLIACGGDETTATGSTGADASTAASGQNATSCGNGGAGGASASSNAGGSMMASFELIGDWSYWGDLAGFTNTMTISETAMLDVGDSNGSAWNIDYKVSSYDNDADQALFVVTKTDVSHKKVGDKLYMSWNRYENVAKFYFASSDYAVPSGGEEGDEYFIFARW